jgi:hypothetical protein
VGFIPLSLQRLLNENPCRISRSLAAESLIYSEKNNKKGENTPDDEK